MVANEANQGAGKGAVVGQPPKATVRYTVGICAGAMVLFILLLWLSADAQGEESSNRSWTVLVIAEMFVAGALGASLYSLRGLIQHSSANDFSLHYSLWYYLSPLSGGISGVVVFFLLLGGALTLNLSRPSDQALSQLAGIGLAPYLAFALLAGYAAREFMNKMKDLADSLFALSKG